MAGELERFNNVNHGPAAPLGQFTWGNLVATATLAAILFGGSWVLFQAQFANLEKQIVVAKAAEDHDSELLRGHVMELELELRNSVLWQREFKQFENQVGDLKRRVELLEQTRPTADTLQTVSTGLKERIDALATAYQNLSTKLNDFDLHAARSPVERPELELVREQVKELTARIDTWVNKTTGPIKTTN